MCPPGAFQVEHEASLTSLEVGFQEASLTFILPRKGPLIAHCLASSGSIGRKKVRSAHGSHGGIGLNSLEIGAIHALEASATVRIERHRLLGIDFCWLSKISSFAQTQKLDAQTAERCARRGLGFVGSQ
mmetsp:Transcript_148984/g.477157  ORF Transcript_148984/g.477157 Transcript_148984/m.477157 type:complete len:129 (-) Transcript_148984:534-920(-)